ncbi:MAG TPA: hypothetical protein VFE57_07345 [Cyclobacteriaceae bacterium]|jgi:hypothetical protein|nr:hypothetical protein [Cyclobacteriaceae bacterium]
MSDWSSFFTYSIPERIKVLYEEGTFVMAIRYYGYKVNLYLFENSYVEVFYNHKKDRIEKITPLDTRHSRMKFYYDQIKLPQQLA